MKPHKYVIVGGGMAAAAAVGGIREVDPHGSIAVICAEKHAPYDRPPLSKALWTGQKTVAALSRDVAGPGVELHLGKRVVALDAAKKTVTDDAGNVHGWEKLLLATGGAPRRLPFADEGTIYFRTLDDYLRLREFADGGASFAVIGGGFIGSEIAAALAMYGKRVTMVFPEEGIGARIYPRGLSAFLDAYFRERSVTVLPGQSVSGLRRDGARIALSTGTTEVSADAVVAGIGIVPEVGLAQSAGLAVDNGIVVDEYLRTGHPDILAAGDVASFYSPVLDRRLRLEHEDNANTMGAWPDATWPGGPNRTTTCRSSTPILRPRLRGGGRARFAARRRRGLEGTLPEGSGLLPARGPGSRRAAVEHVGPDRGRHGDDRVEGPAQPRATRRGDQRLTALPDCARGAARR